MSGIMMMVIAIVVLGGAYIFYGRYLEKKWGIDPNAKTPAYEMEDGVDYVPADTNIVFGHQFASIAGAGPINGPIQAAIFGWLPVLLWILIGGVFFGAVQDFSAMYASVKNKGRSIGSIIETYIGKTGKKLFLLFCWLFCILVVAAFADVVAGTFNGFLTADDGTVSKITANGAVATTSMLFIIEAVCLGMILRYGKLHKWVNTAIAIVMLVGAVALGMNFPMYLPRTTWHVIIFIYILIASVAPVWSLLQPRDYLNSYLLIFMIIAAIVGVFVANPQCHLEAFTSFNVDGQTLFPILFVTIACGAVSGFHSLVSSGTTSKQLDKEKDAKPIAYGGMLLECVLAVLTLCAIGYAYKWNAAHPDAALTGATAIFGGGIAHMIDDVIPGSYSILNSLLVLTYSAFCLTSLDTATRLARFMFQEFWLEPGETAKDVKEGWKKLMVNPYFATILTVVLGILLGMTGYAKIWGLFGAANQLLAGIGLLAVATWLGNAGKNNKMFLIPMAFMIVVTICSLCLTVKNQIGMIAAGGADWGPWAQTIFGILLIVLAIVLVIEGVQTLRNPKKAA